MREGDIIIAGSATAALDGRLLRTVRGSLWSNTDVRFLTIALISGCIHVVGSYFLSSIQVRPAEPMALEELPERFAKLILEMPLPKKKEVEPAEEGQKVKQDDGLARKEKPASPEQAKVQRRAAAKKAVAARAARVERKIRTVGVLSMLTGVGTTAKGPSVVNVLGAVGNRKERFQDLEDALGNMEGIVKATDAALARKTLVKSKDVAVSHTESIDDLVASLGKASAASLAKKGTFVIRKPQSIEGAASSHAKREVKAISKVVVSHKISIRMSYERYLKRDPSLSGKITVRFTIAASGRVTKVEILENSTGSKGLEHDIMRKVKMWRFEPIPQGQVTVTYPFVFRPS